ncbi:hypothetical protein BJY52DRAFT_1265631 [Lactarius psammicola]|nr:hypothetical protein BJY52DRAFT_1265631 [Lactarius psammicola]
MGQLDLTLILGTLPRCLVDGAWSLVYGDLIDPSFTHEVFSALCLGEENLSDPSPLSVTQSCLTGLRFPHPLKSEDTESGYR